MTRLGVAIIAALMVAGATACTASKTAGVGDTGRTVSPASTTPTSSPAHTRTCTYTACLTDPAAFASVQKAANTAVTAVNTYDYRHLGADRARALRVITGTYARDFLSSFDQVIAPTAGGLKAIQSARVDSVGVVSESTSTAITLVAGQVTLSRGGAAPKPDPFCVLVHLTLVSGQWRISLLNVDPQANAAFPDEPGISSAITAARKETTNLFSYRRASFDADYARALAGTSGSLYLDLQASKQKTLSLLTTSHIDLSATVRAQGVMSVGPDTVVLLERIDGVRSDASGRPTPQTLQVTASLVGTQWLLSGAHTVGGS